MFISHCFCFEVVKSYKEKEGDVMRRIQAHRDVVAILAGLVSPVGVAAGLSPFRASFAGTASALVLVAVVVAVAANGNRTAGFVAAVSASLWFDFFLTKPYERFAITHRPDIETAISLFVVGVAVTELAARNRRHHLVAVEGSDNFGVVYYLAELVASGASVERVVEGASVELTELLHLRRCRFDATLNDTPMARIEHDGNVNVGNVDWGAHNMGLPGPEVKLVVEGRGRSVGRFVFEPTPGWPVSLHRRLVAVAIADQVGAAIVPFDQSA